MKKNSNIEAESAKLTTPATSQVVPTAACFRAWFEAEDKSEEFLDSTGKPLDPKTTASVAFREWFGESKVEDARGNPLTVYHGTTTPSKKFTSRNEGYGRFGHWFNTLPQGVHDYAQGSDRGDHSTILAVYLRVEKPYVFSDMEVFKQAVNANTAPTRVSVRPSCVWT